jgi:outer membrane protein TolC
MNKHLRPAVRLASFLTVTVLLSGCASLSSDGGMNDVSALTKQRTGQSLALTGSPENIQENSQQISKLLAMPLTADTAVELAFLNNQALKASFAELGISEADFVQAGRLRNPGISFARMRGGQETEIDRSVMFDVAGLFTLPLRTGIERNRFEQAKFVAAGEAVRLASETRRAFFTAVAAEQAVGFATQVLTAAEASAELARLQARVGNWSKLDKAREQAFYADATTQLARARHAATSSREQLIRLLGLWGTDIAFKLPDRLPDLPPKPNEGTSLEKLAMEQRLDIQVATRDVSATASALGLTKATGFINVLDAGYANKSMSGAPRQNGYEISLELPIFDWGTARRARAQATYMLAVHRTADVAVRARSQVREAYSAYRTTYDIAKHYRDDVVPLRKQISDEVLLRYNGMLASIFELLSDARDQVTSVNSAIESQRDFWIAETELQAAVNGSGSNASETTPTTSPASTTAAAAH